MTGDKENAGAPQSGTFFMTYARTRPNEIAPWAERNSVPLLTNTIHRWSDPTEQFLPMWRYDTAHAIDAGGYNVLGKWVRERVNVRGPITKEHAQAAVEADPEGHSEELNKPAPFYPWTVEQYHGWLGEHSDEFLWASVMDYACEEKFDPLMSKTRRMRDTIRNSVTHYNYSPEYGLLPVLQGRSVDDYVWSHDELVSEGIPTDYVGLGTVCRLSGEKKIVEYEQQVRDRTDVDSLHGFGVKIEAYKQGATFDSADSQAWARAPTNGFMYVDEVTRLGRVDMPDDSLKRTVGSFKHYYVYVKRLMGDPVEIELDRNNVAMQSTLPKFGGGCT